MITKQIGRAMAAAVTRVNESPERLQERLDEANAIIDNLRAQMRELKRELSAYRLNSDEYRSGRTNHVADITGEAINGRPVYTIAAAAKAAGMKYHSAYRRAISGKWESVQHPDRSWRVYADQALTK